MFVGLETLHAYLSILELQTFEISTYLSTRCMYDARPKFARAAMFKFVSTLGCYCSEILCRIDLKFFMVVDAH